jgi:hypothetical protein
MLLENYLKGYDIADVSLDESGYNYYGFTRPDGSVRILRESIDGLEYRYYISKDNYNTRWASRVSLVYRKTYDLPQRPN